MNHHVNVHGPPDDRETRCCGSTWDGWTTRCWGVYFVVVLGIGVVARRAVGTSADFLLAGRSLPAWVTGLAFAAANLGATEIIGMAADRAQHGVATVHYYWIGAIPAMVFLDIVMMPFHYRSKVRSVPGFLRLRYNNPPHPTAEPAVSSRMARLFDVRCVIGASSGSTGSCS